MRVLVVLAALVLLAFLLPLLVIVVGLTGGLSVSGGPVSSVNTVSGIASSGIFTTVADAALALQNHIYGTQATLYDSQHDPFMKRVMAYWLTYCHSGQEQLCSLAQSGNLQCVEFVTAAQWLAGDPLSLHPDAITFWQDYAHLSDWQAIPSPSSFPGVPFLPPMPGDLVVWSGGAHLETQADGSQQRKAYGHIAVVVGYQAPSGGSNGTLTVAQANAPGNRYSIQSAAHAGNTYSMTVHPDGRIDTWGPFIDASGIAYGGYTIVGFLRHHQPTISSIQATDSYATTLPTGITLQMPFVQEAWNDAVSAGIPAGYFVRQIQAESGFNPNAVSSAGAVGIAQFLPGTASALPNPLGAGPLDPLNPHEALLAAARLMAASVRQYRGDYAKALAAYNGGDGEVQYAVATATSAGDPAQWMRYLYDETRQYLHSILGI